MIAGEVVSFVKGNDDAEFAQAALIELTEWGENPFIELAANVGKRRVYFKFRISDLLREIEEAKQ